jgi:hypothetical protein
MTAITVKVPDILNRKLQAVAGKSGLSKSALMRNAIEASLENGVPTSKQATAYDLLETHIGKVSGPSDLSCNQRRMRGYGT